MDDRTPRPSANRTSTTTPLATCCESGTEMPAMAAKGSGTSRAIERFFMTTPSQIDAKPTMPIIQPRTAFQPATKSSGGRVRSASRAASDASFPALAMLAGPMRIRPMANRPATVSTFDATALRVRATSSPRPMPNRPAMAA